MPTPADSLRRVLRELELAIRRGDEGTANLLRRAASELEAEIEAYGGRDVAAPAEWEA